MLPSRKYQIARPGCPSRQMTMSEINLGLASGDVLPSDQYWIKGMSRWERVTSMSDVIIPTAPTHAQKSSASEDRPLTLRVDDYAIATADHLPFWSRRETKPRIALWSPGLYTFLSVFFTPLLGTILIAQNHRASRETTWQAIAWFWLIAWCGFLLTAISLHFGGVSCGSAMHWVLGFGLLVIVWLFTCALPHRAFLNARTFEAEWRTDWGKPVGFGSLAWMVVFAVYLLTR